ncbi:hypothetical protein [Microbacterium sp. che218]|uniref:hypothetical protein n=1 Tax=Microbacterium sp. che218 TaxID=3140649 RepID=UPI003367360C
MVHIEEVQFNSRTIIRCDRCPKRIRVGRSDGWNIIYKRGVIIGFLCSQCQTPEENAEAEINEATLDYGVDAFGRAVARPKGAFE